VWRPSLRRKPNAVLRLCRDRVEWWAPGQASLEHRGASLIEGESGSDLVPLEQAMRSLLEAHRADLEGCRLDVVIESAWLPVVAIDTRRQLMSSTELDALLKHRIEHTYRDGSASPQSWDTRLSHQPGDDLAVGFAIDVRLKRMLLAQLASCQARALSMQPAFTWGWDQSRQERREACKGAPAKSVWWLWEESDRTLAALAGKGQVRVLNVAAPQAAQQDAVTIARREALRHGIAHADLPVLMASPRRLPVRTLSRRPVVDFLQSPGQPVLGWLLLLVGVAMLVCTFALHQHREGARAREAMKAEARADALRREREAALRPHVMSPEERRLRHVQPELDRPWLPLMRAIESSTESPVFLLALSMDPSSGRLQIDAEAPSFDEAMGYVQRLADVDLLKSVQIVSHDNVQDPWGRSSVKFTVAARWSAL
jgi:hypothetical protein